MYMSSLQALLALKMVWGRISVYYYYTLRSIRPTHRSIRKVKIPVWVCTRDLACIFFIKFYCKFDHNCKILYDLVILIGDLDRKRAPLLMLFIGLTVFYNPLTLNYFRDAVNSLKYNEVDFNPVSKAPWNVYIYIYNICSKYIFFVILWSKTWLFCIIIQIIVFFKWKYL